MPLIKDVYRKGGGGGMGSYVITIQQEANGIWYGDIDWRTIYSSYRNAESLYLSIIKDGKLCSVLDIDTATELEERTLKLMAVDNNESILYTVVINRDSELTVTTTPWGGGGISDITYEEI